MNLPVASAVLEIRAIVREPESLESIIKMQRAFLCSDGKLVNSNYLVRCTVTNVDASGYKLVCALNLQAINKDCEFFDLHFLMDRVCVHFKLMAQRLNCGFSVSHSTYDTFFTKGLFNVKERKQSQSRKAAKDASGQHASHLRVCPTQRFG